MKGFFYDLTDRLAESHGAPLANIGDLARSAIVVASAALSNLQLVNNFSMDFFGIPGVLIPPIFAAMGAIYCFHVIRAKVNEEKPGFSGDVSPRYMYSHNLRIIAKAGLVLLLGITLPVKSVDAWKQTERLPHSIYGYVVSADTGKPLANINVRIVDDGVDVTESSLQTDDEGFFVARTTERVRRDAKAVLFSSLCKRSVKFPLSDRFEIEPTQQQAAQDIYPVYRFYLGGGPSC